MNFKKVINLKNLIKDSVLVSKFGRKEKKYAFFLAIAAFTALSTGFTAPNDGANVPAAEVEETENVPSDEMKKLIAAESQNLPSGITVSDNGSLSLTDSDANKQLLADVVNETLVKVEEADELNEVEQNEINAEVEVSSDVESVSNVTEVEEPVDNNDYGSPYAAIMAMEATAYLPTDGNGAGITAMGIPATYGIAAVDPSVIPLGSRLYIPGYGEALAADTGGAIYGYKIDLCMESYDEAMRFGRRTITVYVLK